MNAILEVVADILLIAVVFVMIGGFSHRNGGTCNERHRSNDAQAQARPAP